MHLAKSTPSSQQPKREWSFPLLEAWQCVPACACLAEGCLLIESWGSGTSGIHRTLDAALDTFCFETLVSKASQILPLVAHTTELSHAVDCTARLPLAHDIGRNI